MKSRIFVAAALATLYPALCAAQFVNCGDANGDGTVNINDVTYSLDYFIVGGPPPVDFDTADVDGYDLFTINDIQWMITCAFLCDFQGNCTPTLPPISPPLEPNAEFVYNNIIPSGKQTFGIHFGLQGADVPLESYLGVLQILIDGLPADIDSVVFDTTKPASVLPFSYIGGPGSVILGAITLPSGPWDNDFL
ncbi:MAG TPA: hypothetical protein VLB27_09110, partial [candidate division Zixibacteria bacterium]|nr:hypothetical protein [candidate division Zixibacteria bacterium]